VAIKMNKIKQKWRHLDKIWCRSIVPTLTETGYIVRTPLLSTNLTKLWGMVLSYT